MPAWCRLIQDIRDMEYKTAGSRRILKSAVVRGGAQQYQTLWILRKELKKIHPYSVAKLLLFID